MGWAHYRQGDKEGAYSEFMKAYTLNERYVDAQYALDFLASN